MAAPEQPIKRKDPSGYPTTEKIVDDIGLYETVLSSLYDLPEVKMGPTPMQTVVVGEQDYGNVPVRTRQKTEGDASRIASYMEKTGASPNSIIANPMNYTGKARGVLQMEPERIQDAIGYLVAQEKAGNPILDKASSILDKISPTKVSSLDTLKTLVKEKAADTMLSSYSIEDIKDEMTNYPNPILDLTLALAATKASKKREGLYPSMSYSGKATTDYQSPADKEKKKYETKVDKYIRDFYK